MLFLDADCNSGVAGHPVLARLTSTEAADDAAVGDAIQNHGPASFAERDVGPDGGQRFHAAVTTWIAAQ